MAAPIPLEPPVTRATLPLNDFVCIWPPKPPSHPLCHIMDCSVQNEHSVGAAKIRANGRNDEIICIGNLRTNCWRGPPLCGPMLTNLRRSAPIRFHPRRKNRLFLPALYNHRFAARDLDPSDQRSHVTYKR